ncbi:MAG: amino acid adenylation domain-containing protein [Blastocatellia bacterium]
MAAIGDRAEDAYPLSPLQQGMLFHHLYAEHSGVDVEQFVYTLHHSLDIEAFKRAWQRVVDRHAILRTGFRREGFSEPHQVVYKDVRLEWDERDWRHLSAAERKVQLEEFLRADRERGFALTEPTLNRMALFCETEADYQFVWTFHHAILDGRSLVQVVKEVFDYYEAFCQGRAPDLPRPRPYRQYIDWLGRQDWKRAEDYWRAALAGFQSPTPIVKRPPGAGALTCSQSYKEQPARLSRATTEALRAFAVSQSVTLNTLVQGAWALLLSRYYRIDDVVFGATRACRKSVFADADQMVGLFINTLPMRIRVKADAELGEWLGEIRRQHMALRDVEHTPLMRVQEWSEAPRGKPLFDSILVFENHELDELLKSQGGEWLKRDYRLVEQTNYPLSLSAWAGRELLLRLDYDARDFADDEIAAMLRHLVTMLEAMPVDLHRRLGRLPMLSDEERRRLLVEWGVGPHTDLAHACMQEMFEAQAERTPDAIAVQGGERCLSYRELNSRANQLARHLQAQGVGPDTLVGIALDRSPEMLVAMLGTLKAGGGYVPLDPAYPPARLAAMLDDARPVVLVTQARMAGKLMPRQTQVVKLDDDWPRIARQSDDNLPVATTPANLAYVIYTSGSTGKPKGVMIEHASLVNYTLAAGDEHGIMPEDRVLQFASMSFDASAEEIYPCLRRGARLVLRSDKMLASHTAFLEQCRDWQISVLDLPTAYWHELTDYLEASGECLPASLRLVIIGGERAQGNRLRTWQRLVGGRVRLLNTYGPTETTVVATSCDLTAAMAGEATVEDAPIGRPVANARAYILDNQLQPMPVGVVGQLCIGGAGVARGYLNQPQATAAKFIADPFAEMPDARLYKTGDLARYLPDGQIVFCGRQDRQVKVHGFRIELDEVGAAIAAHSSVREAVVLAHEDESGPTRLIAYAVLSTGDCPEDRGAQVAELRSFLQRRLPHYMIPSAFVFLPEMPLSANGKINYELLPAPQPSRGDLGGTYVKPRDPLEHQLAQIWEELFALRPIGVTDGFFDLGGDSLLAIRMMDAMERALGKSLPLATLFAGSTIRHLAESLLTQETADLHAPVVEIQRGNGRLPFFYLHGDFSGGGLYCRRLARQLGDEQPFYALQPHGLMGQPPPSSIEAMAEAHLKTLREVRPRGPYILGGHCNGGLIAFEMARRLEAAGEHVALLALVCTTGVNTRFRKLHRLSRAFCSARRKPEDKRQQHFLDWRERAIRLEGLRDYYAGRLRDLRRSPIGVVANFVRSRSRQAARVFIAATGEQAAQAGRAAESDAGFGTHDTRAALGQAYAQAMAAYVPGRYGGRVTLLWPDELPCEPSGDATCGWHRATTEVETHVVPGGHLTCVTNYVEHLAARLRPCIERAQQSAAGSE